MKHCASLLVVIGILLLALSVSPKTAIMVVALYLLFHALEIYYIVPKVYGKHLRVSTLTV
jgi:predicted PurR-regulated permease PerM